MFVIISVYLKKKILITISIIFFLQYCFHSLQSFNKLNFQCQPLFDFTLPNFAYIPGLMVKLLPVVLFLLLTEHVHLCLIIGWTLNSPSPFSLEDLLSPLALGSCLDEPLCFFRLPFIYNHKVHKKIKSVATLQDQTVTHSGKKIQQIWKHFTIHWLNQSTLMFSVYDKHINFHW